MRDVLPADGVPDGGCVEAAGGRVLLARVDGRIRAYRNTCPHAGTRLSGGVVRDGVLTCPGHLWRFDLADGRAVAGRDGLDRVDVEVVDGRVRVDLPGEDTTPIRERLLAHARDWDRDGGTERGATT